MPRNDTTPQQIELSLGFPSSSDGDAYARLEIVDNDSRQGLVSVKLTPDEFLQLMRGRVLLINAAIPDQKYLSRIGRMLVVESAEAPERYCHEREVTPDLRMWADGECTRRGFEEATLRRNRDGWSAHFRKWVAK